MAKSIIDLLSAVYIDCCMTNESYMIIKAFQKAIQYSRKIKLYKEEHQEIVFEKFRNQLIINLGKTSSTINEMLNSHGITDAHSLATAIIDNFDWLQANSWYNEYLVCLDITQPITNMPKKKLTKRQQVGKDLYDSSERYRGMSIKKAKRYVKNNKNTEERLVVVRNRWGNTEPSVYVMHGPWNEIEVRKFRMAYAYKTCSNYYEASPILYSTCIDDPDRFYMTKPGNKDLELDDEYCA